MQKLFNVRELSFIVITLVSVALFQTLKADPQNDADLNMSSDCEIPTRSSLVDFVGLTASGTIVTFNSGSPGTTSNPVIITGLAAGETLVGIDVRPADNLLIGLGYNPSNGIAHVYSINIATGATRSINDNSLVLGTVSIPSRVTMDFDPSSDQLRIVTNALLGNNLRIPSGGTSLLVRDTNLNPQNHGVIAATAYSRNNPGGGLGGRTTLYDIDLTHNELVTQDTIDGAGHGSSGTLLSVAPLSGVQGSAIVGFDIFNAPGTAETSPGTAFVATASSLFYTLDLNTGAASLLGVIGGGAPLKDIAAGVPATPPSPTPTGTPTNTTTPTNTATPTNTPTPYPFICGLGVGLVTSTGIGIPDNSPSGMDTTITVNGGSTINDLNFRFDGNQGRAGVVHSRIGDLIFRLTSPAGTTVTFFDRPGYMGLGFGCESNDLTELILDDEALLAVENQCGADTNSGPLSGVFLPNNPLSAFDGQNPNGVWTLNTSDNAPGEIGYLSGWTLLFNCTAPTLTPTSTPANTPIVTATATNTPTSTPTATPVAGTVSGTITYGNAIGAPTPRFVSTVLVNGAGSVPVSAFSGFPSGTYSLSGFGSGVYTITPSKTGGVNGITSFDAAKVAQHAAGVSILTGNQLVVADVSGNGTVSSFDAGQIARYTAGLSGSGATANWIFTPANRNYASVTGNITGEDFVALLMGEVSGNWTNTGAR